MKEIRTYLLPVAGIILFCLNAASGVVAPAVDPAVDMQQYSERMQFANGLYTRKMYDLASREYASIVMAFPNGKENDAATFRLAESLRLQGKIDEAAKLYSRIVVHYKNSPFRLRAAYRRGRIYMDLGDYQSASAHFGAILRENPPAELAAATLFYLGESQLKSGNRDSADKTFIQLIQQHPDSMFQTHALMYRGEIYRDKWLESLEKKEAAGDQFATKALGFFQQALSKETNERMAAEDLFQMAEIYFRQHKYEKSTELYHQLMTQYPHDERALTAGMQAAWSASNSGMYAEALNLANKALSDPALKKSRDEWLYLKANAERQLMQNRDAVKSYLRLLIKYPDSRFSVPARYEIAVTYFKMGKYQDAIHHAEMIRITPEVRSDVCWLLAESYAALNKSAEAVQYYRMVVRTDPTSDRARDAMYRLAHQLQTQNAWREASQAYNKLVAQFPKSDLAPKSLYASAFSLQRANAYDKAVRDWRRLVTDYPKSKLVEDAMYQKALCEIRLSRKQDATATLDELIRRFPQGRFVADAFYWKGVLLFELKQYQPAEDALRMAMNKSTREELKSDAAFQLGIVLQNMQKPQEAAELFKGLLDDPVNTKFSPALLEWLAGYYAEQKNAANSEKAARLLIARTKEKGWQQTGYVLLGRALDKQGKDKTAADAYRKALSIKVITRYTADAALRLGDIELARQHAAKATDWYKVATAKTTPDNALAIKARAYMGLGRAADAGGDKADASRYYMSIAILYDDPKLVPEALYRAAVAYDGLRHKEDRNKAAQELMKRYPKSTWAGKVDVSWLK